MTRDIDASPAPQQPTGRRPTAYSARQVRLLGGHRNHNTSPACISTNSRNVYVYATHRPLGPSVAMQWPLQVAKNKEEKSCAHTLTRTHTQEHTQNLRASWQCAHSLRPLAKPKQLQCC
jgi:hypothetical protein